MCSLERYNYECSQLANDCNVRRCCTRNCIMTVMVMAIGKTKTCDKYGCLEICNGGFVKQRELEMEGVCGNGISHRRLLSFSGVIA